MNDNSPLAIMQSLVGHRPILFRVTFDGDDVLQNGIVIARMSRGPEVWVQSVPRWAEDLPAGHPATTPKFIARFKYARPRTKAKEFAKAVFSRVTVGRYLALRGEG